MAASGAQPLIWHALKKKSGRRSSGGTAGVRQQKEELVHSVKNNPPLNLIARGKSFRLRRSFRRAPVLFRPGRRAAEHPQGVRRRRKRQSRQRRTQGGGPYGLFYR